MHIYSTMKGAFSTGTFLAPDGVDFVDFILGQMVETF